jgi:Icc-related predicted phosphoesterase
MRFNSSPILGIFMNIVCISDTHCRLRKVKIPDGDILVHTGDLTFKGDIAETSQELRELGRHKDRFKAIILVEGNQDWLGARQPALMDQMCKDNGITLLRDSGTTVEGLRIYGSPWQPEFCRWAFNLPRGEPLKEKWGLIPDDTQVLLTHSPPMGILDYIEEFNGNIGEFELKHLGCADLYNRVMELKDLKLSVFGHIHHSNGMTKIGNTTFINASICTEQYKPKNLPFIFSV